MENKNLILFLLLSFFAFASHWLNYYRIYNLELSAKESKNYQAEIEECQEETEMVCVMAAMPKKQLQALANGEYVHKVDEK